jgi:hypothetical protein
VNREEAIALLKEIAANKIATISWISLNSVADGYEIILKGEVHKQSLRQIVQKHNLSLKEANGLFVIYQEHELPQGP